MIPLFDLAYQHKQAARGMQENTAQVVRHEAYIGGEMLQRFEDAMCRYLGVGHAIGVANGTDALTLILRALGIGAGDEVITTGYSFWATAECILSVGATPVFVDIAHDYNIDVTLIEAAITPRTTCILPVHLFGRPCDMPRIIEIARRHNLYVVEDACQAIGAEGICVGDAVAFSFYPTKNLGAMGDGGMVVTDSAVLAERVRHLANHGARERHVHTEVGINSRLDALQAAVLLGKLPYLDEWNALRSVQAQRYDEAFGRDTSGGVHHLYCIEGTHIDGVETAVCYPLPLHKQPAIASDACLPVAEKCAGNTIAIPLHPGLTHDQQDAVIRALIGG